MSSISTQTNECIMTLLSLPQYKNGATIEDIQRYLEKNDTREPLRNIEVFLEEDFNIQEDTKNGITIYRDIIHIPEQELNIFRLSKETFLDLFKEIYKNMNVNHPVEMFNTPIPGDKRHTVFDYLAYFKCLKEIKSLLETYPGYAIYFLHYNYYTQKCAADYLKEESIHFAIIISYGLITDKVNGLKNTISENKMQIKELDERLSHMDTAYMMFHAISMVSIICIQIYLYYINHY